MDGLTIYVSKEWISILIPLFIYRNGLNVKLESLLSTLTESKCKHRNDYNTYLPKYVFIDWF